MGLKDVLDNVADEWLETPTAKDLALRCRTWGQAISCLKEAFLAGRASMLEEFSKAGNVALQPPLISFKEVTEESKKQIKAMPLPDKDESIEELPPRAVELESLELENVDDAANKQPDTSGSEKSPSFNPVKERGQTGKRGSSVSPQNKR